MHLLIMRHGEATTNASSDYLNELTNKGRTQVISTADYISRADISVSQIICSPYVRTIQTAEILISRLGLPHSTLKKTELVTPESSVSKWFSEVELNDNTLIVSHMPFIAKLTSYYVDGNLHGSYPFTTAQLRTLKIYSPMAGGAVITTSV